MTVGTLGLRLGLLTELVGFLAMPLGHRPMPLGLGLEPSHLLLAGDPSPLRELPHGEQHNRNYNHCDDDDHNR